MHFDAGRVLYVVTSPLYPQPYPTSGHAYSYTVKNPYRRGFIALHINDADLGTENSVRVTSVSPGAPAICSIDLTSLS